MLLMLFGTWVSGDCVHVCLPKIKERENEYPHQVDEMPVQPGDLHRLIAPLTVIKSAPNPQSYDSQVDNTRRYVQAVEPGDHKKHDPNCVAPRGFPQGRTPSRMSLVHSNACMPTKVAPNAAVISISAVVLARWRR